MKKLKKVKKYSSQVKVNLYVSESGSNCTNSTTCGGAGNSCTNNKTC